MILLLHVYLKGLKIHIRHEVEDTNIDVAYVPGAFENSTRCKIGSKGEYDAVITLGCD